MASFCQVEASLDNAQGDIVTARQRYDSASQQATQADSLLDMLATTYAPIVSEITAQHTADPTNAAWANLKARLDLTLAERATLVADTQVAVNCFTVIFDKGAAAVQAALDAIP